MSIPQLQPDVPDRVRELAGGVDPVAVWVNGIGGVTFRAGDRFIKYGPIHAETSMRDEAARLRWAGEYTNVPTVLDEGTDGTNEWLVTAALPGLSAVDPVWISRPERAVRAVGRGLRLLHDALPVAACPYDWSVPSRVKNAAQRGITVPDHLRNAPDVDVLVVCHGDPCVPNTLLTDAGDPLAHVDLGALGVADRWADIAVAAMSTTWNYGPGYEDMLIEAYGVRPDRERLAYYSALWDAT